MKRLTFLIFIITLQACAVAGESTSSNVNNLRWVENSDVETDTRDAIEKMDYRLLSMATRSVSIPGIDPEEQADLGQQCGIRPLRYTSDVIRSPEQLELQKKVRSYAKAYNTIMKQACLGRR